MHQFIRLATVLLFLVQIDVPSTFADESTLALLAQADGKALQCGNQAGWLSVAGHKTRVRWPGHTPSVHPAGDHIFVLSGRFSEDHRHSFLWNDTTKELQQIDGVPMAIGRNSFVLLSNNYWNAKHKPSVLSIDPRTGESRVLWQAPAGPKQYLNTLGRDENKLFLLVNRSGRRTLLTLEAGKQPRETPVDVGTWKLGLNGDSVRGAQILATRLKHSQDRSSASTVLWRQFQAPPLYEVACWNMETSELQELGDVEGAWLPKGALPDPILSLSWITAAESQQLGKQTTKMAAFMPANFVVAETLELISQSGNQETNGKRTDEAGAETGHAPITRMALLGFSASRHDSPTDIFDCLDSIHNRLRSLGLSKAQWRYKAVGDESQNLPLSKKYVGFALVEIHNATGKSALEKELSNPQAFAQYGVEIVHFTGLDTSHLEKAMVAVNEKTMTCGYPDPEKTSFPITDKLLFKKLHFSREFIVPGPVSNNALIDQAKKSGGVLQATITTDRHESIAFTNLQHPPGDVRYYWKRIVHEKKLMSIGGQQFHLSICNTDKIAHE